MNTGCERIELKAFLLQFKERERDVLVRKSAWRKLSEVVYSTLAFIFKKSWVSPLS